jgi:hypothetical protein
VGNAAVTSYRPSARTATTDGPPTSGRNTRPTSAPVVPSTGRVATADGGNTDMATVSPLTNSDSAPPTHTRRRPAHHRRHSRRPADRLRTPAPHPPAGPARPAALIIAASAPSVDIDNLDHAWPDTGTRSSHPAAGFHIRIVPRLSPVTNRAWPAGPETPRARPHRRTTRESPPIPGGARANPGGSAGTGRTRRPTLEQRLLKTGLQDRVRPDSGPGAR